MTLRTFAPLILVLCAGCGYSIAGSTRGPLVLDVAPIEERGIDVDAAALVGASLRRTIARGPGTRLGPGPDATRLEVELVTAGSSLQAFADPSVRAAQYQEIVELRGRLVDASGNEVWRSEL
ncbi:hypothetical protein L6R52_34705, partial [Myxococcota bacterium]|nr:hypothetical protein [Myxococcota bacterium]